MRLSVLLFLALLGCDREERDARISVDRQPWCVSDAMRSHTLECIRGAGHSGESEPEDWIRICERQARRLHCPIEFTVLYMGATKRCSEALSKPQRWCRVQGWSE